MQSMELFIVIIALVAAAGSSLILLIALAAKRSELIKAFTLRQETEQREKEIEKEFLNKNADKSGDPAPTA